MSSITRFKWQRPIPPDGTTFGPGYYRYNLNNMRQLQSVTYAMPSGTGPTIMASCYVPAGSWGEGKSIIFRMCFAKNFPPASWTTSVFLGQGILITGAAGVPIGAPSSFVPVSGTWYDYIEFKLIRIDPNILLIDMNGAYQYDGLGYIVPVNTINLIPPVPPPFPYEVQMEIDFTVTIPFSTPPWTLTGIWVQAFLEAGTNLGTLN
jgi:hypothetical protein